MQPKLSVNFKRMIDLFMCQVTSFSVFHRTFHISLEKNPLGNKETHFQVIFFFSEESIFFHLTSPESLDSTLYVKNMKYLFKTSFMYYERYFRGLFYRLRSLNGNKSTEVRRLSRKKKKRMNQMIN